MAFQTGAVDFCVRKQGEPSWEGPLLAKLGVSGGADQGTMTNAFARESGAWEVAAVASDATGCDDTVATSTTAVTVPPAGSALVLLIGNGAVRGEEDNAIVGIVDESTAPSAGKARVRFFHASPNWDSGTASLYLGGAQTLTTAAYGALATSSPTGATSAAGYVDVDPSASRMYVKGLSDWNESGDIQGRWRAKADTRATLILHGAAGSSFYPPTVLTCPDDLKPATELDPFAECTR